jgi:hypothetical protein
MSERAPNSGKFSEKVSVVDLFSIGSMIPESHAGGFECFGPCAEMS